jgi:nitric oxide dioxygenase
MRFFRSKVAEVDYRSGTARGEGLRMDLERIDREQLHLDHGAAEYYISGPEAFSFDMSKFLRGQGVDPQRIRNEWFTTGEVA